MQTSTRERGSVVGLSFISTNTPEDKKNKQIKNRASLHLSPAIWSYIRCGYLARKPPFSSSARVVLEEIDLEINSSGCLTAVVSVSNEWVVSYIFHARHTYHRGCISLHSITGDHST